MEYQPQEGDIYTLAVHEGRYIIRRYDGVNWEQLGGGHSEQDIAALVAPMQFVGESKGHRWYYRPYAEDTVALEYIAVYIGIPRYGHKNCLIKRDPDMGDIDRSRLLPLTREAPAIEEKCCIMCGKLLLPKEQ